jgi:hypothetical protein
MNNTAVAYSEEAVPPEQGSGFIPTIMRTWQVVEVNRPRIRASLHPDMIKKDGVWGSVDPRIKVFAAEIKGDEVEKVECRLFRWRDSVSIQEAARRIGRKQGPLRWVPGFFEHLVAYGAALPMHELRSVIIAPGATTAVIEPPRPVFRGPHDEGSTDVCVASAWVGASMKILSVTVLGGKDPHAVCFPKGTSFLGVRRVS